MFNYWLGMLFEVSIELDGNLDRLNTKTIALQYLAERCTMKISEMLTVGAVLDHKNKKSEPPPVKKWMGPRPTLCDICNTELEEQEYWVDGATMMGPWGNMCPACHRSCGKGLGLGKGQKYDCVTLEKLEG